MFHPRSPNPVELPWQVEPRRPDDAASGAAPLVSSCRAALQELRAEAQKACALATAPAAAATIAAAAAAAAAAAVPSLLYTLDLARFAGFGT